MVASGCNHFVMPGLYERVVPGVVGNPGLWVRASGVAEVIGGVLLPLTQTRRVGAGWVTCLLVLVFPANMKMAVDGGLEGERWPLSSPLAAWARLPLQVPLVGWALSEARARPEELAAR